MPSRLCFNCLGYPTTSAKNICENWNFPRE
jgi:hypothetical protein